MFHEAGLTESSEKTSGGGGNIDDFVIDNMVIMYKTLPSLPTNQL
ncbi:MAG TPA: hypothetical protein VGC97_06840 [Pyrinomonadaceae bacterium]